MSRVDVLVPCYNYGRYLRGCVQSALSQPGVEVRVLIIDDCSSDDSPEVGAALAAEDPRVEFRRHVANRGHIATYNEGLLEWADAEYSLLLSADDYLTPAALTRATAAMEAHPEVVFSYGSVVKVYPDSEIKSKPLFSDDSGVRVVTGGDFLEAICRTGENFVPTPTVVVRTTAQKQAGGYRPELPHAGDMEMWMRLAMLGSVAVVPEEQACYRFHTVNMHRSHFNRPSLDIRQRKLVFDNFYKTCGAQLPQLDALQTLSAQALGWSAFWWAVKLFDKNHTEWIPELLELALELYPPIRGTPEFSRFCWKRRVGPRMCSVVVPIARYMRGHARSARFN